MATDVVPTLLRRPVTESGMVTTSCDLVALSALVIATPPPLRRKYTVVLFAPGRKPLPLIVSLSPTLAVIGKTPEIVGADDFLVFFLALCFALDRVAGCWR